MATTRLFCLIYLCTTFVLHLNTVVKYRYKAGSRVGGCIMALYGALALVMAVVVPGHGSYLPSLAPGNYCQKGMFEENKCQSRVSLFVNRLTSEDSIIPYAYSHFDFCQPAETAESVVESLGQVVLGEHIQQSPYSLEFLKDEKCVKVCSKSYKPGRKGDKEKLDDLKQSMNLNYYHYWIVDNMPVTWCYVVDRDNLFCVTGHPVGCYVDGSYRRKGACVMDTRYKERNTYYLFNHVDLNITYHSGDGESSGNASSGAGGRILFVRVNLRSIKHNQAAKDSCDTQEVMAIPTDFKDDLTITYSYSVTFTTPDAEEGWRRVGQGDAQKWNLYNCCGTLDGRHITIQAPASTGSGYFN